MTRPDPERALDLLDVLQGGQCVEIPPGDGDPEWGVDDLLQLAGACLHAALAHPDGPGNLTAALAAARRHAGLVAEAERDAAGGDEAGVVPEAVPLDSPAVDAGGDDAGLSDHQRRLRFFLADRDRQERREAERRAEIMACLDRPRESMPRRPMPQEG